MQKEFLKLKPNTLSKIKTDLGAKNIKTLCKEIGVSYPTYLSAVASNHISLRVLRLVIEAYKKNGFGVTAEYFTNDLKGL